MPDLRNRHRPVVGIARSHVGILQAPERVPIDMLGVLALLQRLLCRYRRIPFGHLLRHFCPLPELPPRPSRHGRGSTAGSGAPSSGGVDGAASSGGIDGVAIGCSSERCGTTATSVIAEVASHAALSPMANMARAQRASIRSDEPEWGLGVG